MATVKQIAQKTILNLPKGSNWDDIFYELYVVKKIEEGLSAEKKGKIKSHEEIKKSFLK